MNIQIERVQFETYPALLLGDYRTLPLIDHAALLRGNILTNFVLDSLTLPLIDNLALGLSPGGALLLHDGRALLLVPGAALLVEFVKAIFPVDGLLDSPGKVHALDLRDRVAFLLELPLLPRGHHEELPCSDQNWNFSEYW